MPHPMTRAARRPAAIGVLLCVLAAPGVAHAKAPLVEQMVVRKSGAATISKVRASGLQVGVGKRRCAVGTATPLAALQRSKVARIDLRDYASCSSRARDAGQIYVRSIGSDRARGTSGWVYKVGRRSASSGAADPSGPFGNGLLRSGQRVTWYFGRPQGQRFQRTLELKVAAGAAASTARATVRSYDDDGHGRLEAGVTVRSGSTTATTAADGTATIATGAGRRSFAASKTGMIRSFDEKLAVR